MKCSSWLAVALFSTFSALHSFKAPPAQEKALVHKGTLQLGNFSVSLTVKDLAKSRAFYEALGFEQAGGNPAQNWIEIGRAHV